VAEHPDRSLFIRLYTEVQPELMRYLMTLVPNEADAAEVLQDAALALWQRFDDYQRDQPFLPWAYRFVYHHALKHRARLSKRLRMLSADVLQRLADHRDQHSDHLDARRDALADCVAKLTGDDQDLIQQRYAGAATVRDLAQQTGRNIHTLYKRLERIRR